MLPENYKLLEYVQNGSAGSYFDTGFKPGYGTKIEFDGYVVSGDTALYGCRTANNVKQYALQLIASGLYRGGYATMQKIFDSAYTAGKRYLFTQENWQYYIDGNWVGESDDTSTGLACEYPLYVLGTVNTKGTAGNFGIVRLYDMRIYQKGVLVHEYVGCTDESGVVGLYDLVENVFLSPAGTADIIAGRVVTALTVTPPTKLKYAVGETLDLSGMTAVVTYEDEVHEDVTGACEVSGYSSDTMGIQTITVSYHGVSSTFAVEVVGLQSLDITPPTKVSYHIGDSLDTAGLTADAVYSDGTRVDVTADIQVSGYDQATAGVQTITVNYLSISAQFTVTVYDVTELQLVPPTKTEYQYGEELDLAGLVVTVVYADGFTENRTDYTVSGYSALTVGEQTVTVSYRAVSASFTVTVITDVTGIEITSLPTKTEYKQGETFSSDGLVVSTINTAGEKEAITDYTLSGFDSAVLGEQTVTASYAGFTASFTVNVVQDILTAKCGTPTTANVVAALDLYTGVLTFEGTGAILGYSSSSWMFSTSYRAKVKQVIVSESITNIGSYLFYQCTNLTEVSLPSTLGAINTYAFYGCTKLKTVSNLDKADSIASYAFYQCSALAGEIHLDSVTSLATYCFAYCTSLKTVTIGAAVTSIHSYTFRYSTAIKSIYVDKEYQIISGYPWGATNATVTWATSPLASLTLLTPPDKTEYRYGETFDKTGLSVRLFYTDGSSRDITDVSVLSVGYSSTKLGTQTVTVTYRTVSTETSITVINYVSGITVLTPPDKTVYEEGERQDYTGLSVAKTYADGSTEEISTFTVANLDYEVLGLQSVVVTYEEFTTSFTVTTHFPTKLSRLLGVTSNMEMIRNNTKNDDGTDTLTGVDWFYFNQVLADNIYVNGNNWIGFGVSAAGLNVCNRDGATWYVRRLEGKLTNGHRFLKIEVEGYTRYNYSSTTYKLVYELYLFDDNSMFLNIIQTPTSSSYLGTSSLVCGTETISYTVEVNTPVMYSFYPGGEGGVDWQIDAMPHKFLIDGIEVVTMPTKTEYRCGEELDLAGMTVALKTDLEKTQLIDEYVVSGYDPVKAGTQSVLVSYLDYQTSFEITVIDGFTVRFLYYDNNTGADVVLKEEWVNYGQAATPPEDTSRSGYIFSGWSGNYKIITWDIDIYAEFIPKNVLTVLFVDYDGRLLKKQFVMRGAVANAPDAPLREGYVFSGWDTAFDYVVTDLTVTALYETRSDTFLVTFLDWDDATLKQERVVYGGGASAPMPPERSGYFFLAWSESFGYITRDLTVQAVYRKNRKRVSAEVYNGNLMVGEIRMAIDCTLSQKLNGECTFELTTLAAYASFVRKRYRVELDGLIFDLTGIEKKAQNGKYLLTIKGEHVSYILNDEDYDITEFSFTGSPARCLAKILQGTPFTAGTVEFTKEVTLKINQKCTRRNALMQLVALCGGELEYDKYSIGIREHIGRTDPIELMDTENVKNVGMSYNASENTETYSVELYRKQEIALGDEIHIVFRPLSIDKTKRIAGIDWNPFNFRKISVSVGGYRASLSDTLYQVEEDTDTTAQDLQNLSDKVEGLSDSFDSLSGNLGGFNVLSVYELPANPDMNTIYLIQGTVEVN